MSDHAQASTPSSATTLIRLVHPLKVSPGQLVVDCGGSRGRSASFGFGISDRVLIFIIASLAF